jgi:hypothetical protein
LVVPGISVLLIGALVRRAAVDDSITVVVLALAASAIFNGGLFGVNVVLAPARMEQKQLLDISDALAQIDSGLDRSLAGARSVALVTQMHKAVGILWRIDQARVIPVDKATLRLDVQAWDDESLDAVRKLDDPEEAVLFASALSVPKLKQPWQDVLDDFVRAKDARLRAIHKRALARAQRLSGTNPGGNR